MSTAPDTTATPDQPNPSAGSAQRAAKGSAKGRALKASALMAAGSSFSRVLGFVRIYLMGMVFGGSASIAANAFSAANVLPNSIWILIGGGTLNAILVPAIVRAMKRPDGGADYMSRLFTLVLLVAIGVTALCTALVPLLLIVANSKLDPATMQAATVLAYFLMPQMLFSAVYIMFGQILNAHESFGPFQFAPALNNVVAILGSLVFLALWGTQPDGSQWSWGMIAVLALSQVLGSASQGVLCYYWARKIGLKITLKWGFRGLGLGTLSKIGLWTLGMMALGQVAMFARRWSVAGAVAEVEELQRTGKGAARGLYPALASLDWSYTVFMLPQGIIAVALITSVFPRMAKQARDGNHAGAYRTYSAMNRTLFVPMVLASTVIMVLAGPIMWVAVGGSSPEAGWANGLVLIGYTIGLVPFAALYLVKRFFYAYEDARVSFTTQIPATVLGLVAIWPILEFVNPKYAAAAAAASASLGALVSWVQGIWAMRRRLTNLGVDSSMFDSKGTASALLRITLAGVVSGLAGWGVLQLCGELTWTSRPVAVMVGAVVAVIITAVFTLAAWALRVDEIRDASQMILSKVKRKRA